MNKNWKQQTPADQMVEIYMAMEGWFSNWRDGLTSKEKFEENMNNLLENVQKLLPYLQGKNEWVPFYGKK